MSSGGASLAVGPVPRPAGETFRPSGALRSIQPPRIASAAFATSSGTSGAGGGSAAEPSAAVAAESVPNEARYWASKYGLGPSRLIPSSTKETAPRKVGLRTVGNAAAECLVFGPRGGGGKAAGGKDGGGGGSKGSFHPLAVAGGPRVAIYGPGPHCALSRALMGDKAKTSEPDLFGGKATTSSDAEGGDDDDDVKADRNVGTGGRPARCASYRPDGRLIAVGTDGGCVRVCDAKSRAALRTFGGRGPYGADAGGGIHSVRGVGWTRDGKAVISGGDDGAVRVWELSGAMGGAEGGGLGSPSSKPRLALRGHGDAVRALLVFRAKMEESEDDVKGGGGGGEVRNLAASGSYDHTVRIWDVDRSDSLGDAAEDRCLSVLNHGAPVETLLLLPPCPYDSSPRLASAGGHTVKIWNPLTGRCLADVATAHSKTITSLALVTIVRNVANAEESDATGADKRTNLRLLTAGLDGLLRIHSADCLLLPPHSASDESETPPTLSFPYLHGVRTPHPITSLAVSPNNSRLAVGFSTGLIWVRQRAKLVRQGAPSNRKRKANLPRAGTYAYFQRGSDAVADADDHVVIVERRKKLKSYDVLLRKFRYGDAVDEALVSRQPDAVVAVLEELSKRQGGLVQALSNRDEETLEPLLAFTARYVTRPRYASVLIPVADLLVDIYGSYVGQSEVIDESFEKLRRAVREECRVRRTLAGLVGMIDAVVWRAAAAEEEEGAAEDEDEEES